MLLSLNLVQDAIEVLFIEDLVLVFAKDCQYQTIEEDPFVLEEFV